MKHIRSLEVDQPLDELLAKRAAERAFLAEEENAGTNFFRGLTIALVISIAFWAAVLSAVLG